MNQTKLFLTICFSVIFHFFNAQQLQLFIKKGEARLSGIKYSSGHVLTIKSEDKLNVESGTVCILKRKDKIAEIKDAKMYSYKELLKLVSVSKSYTKAFISVATNQQVSLKKSAGITTRGFDENPWDYSPKDSVIILSDSLIIKAGCSPLKLLSDINLYQINSSTSFVLSKDELIHKIKTPSPGIYMWKYSAELKLDKGNASNVFIVPDILRKQQLLSDYKIYEASLIDFSEEIRQLLLEEYCELQKIYINIQ